MSEADVIKSCNNIFSNCYYKEMDSAPPKCIYTGYCDHQLPKDSRMHPFIYNYLPGTDYQARICCVCGGNVCTDGVTCSVCGLPKWRYL